MKRHQTTNANKLKQKFFGHPQRFFFDKPDIDEKKKRGKKHPEKNQCIGFRKNKFTENRGETPEKYYKMQP